MAEIVFAGACSHAGLIVRAADRIAGDQRERIYSAYASLRAALLDSRAEALIVFGADHFRSFQLSNMPAFCVGTGEGAQSWGDAGVPQYLIRNHESLAVWLARSLLKAEIDVATAYNLRLDHGFACPLHLVMPEMTIPVVPVFINCAAGPLPSVSRAHALGVQVRRAVESFVGLGRVAVLGSGGLSHWVPIPDTEAPADEEEARIVALMRAGNDAELRRTIADRVERWVTGNKGCVAEEFDRQFLYTLESGDLSPLIGLGSETIKQRAGNGGQEIRTWLAAAGAAGAGSGRTLVYEPVASWLTGVGVFQWDLAS